MRYTPAGLPVLDMVLEHASTVIEAGVNRTIEMTINAVALGDTAHQLSGTPMGTGLLVNGFIAPARKGSGKLVVHILTARRTDAGTDPVVV